jgi:hypothetical protein
VVGSLERFRDRREPSIPDLDLDGRLGQQVIRPQRTIPGGHQDRAIGLFDIADRDRSRESCASSACRQSGDLALEEQVAADVVRQWIRQRARCQDLPSVWVAGA